MEARLERGSVLAGSSVALRDRFRSDVQGLRAIAVIAVMLFHVNKDWLPGGFVGVDVFFVISGFLIGSIILDAKNDGRFSLIDFYLGRARRIIPAYYALLIVVSGAASIIFIQKDFDYFLTSLKYSAVFFSNRYFSGFGDYFSPESHELPLLHTWSLAIEMQFYILFPLAIACISPRYLRVIFPIIVIALTGYAGYCLIVLGKGQSVYFSLSARVPEFLIGSSVAIFRDPCSQARLSNSILSHWSGVCGFFGLALLVTSFFWINDATAFPGGAALFPTLGAALLIVSSGVVSESLGTPILAWIGGISYSLYLWHWPVLSVLRYFKQSYYLSSGYILFFLVATFGLSYFSWRFVETPFRQNGIYKNRFLVAIFILFFIGFVLALGRVNTALGDILPIELTRYAESEKICHGKMLGECLRGDSASNSEPVLVLGDSHAAQLNIFFDVVGNKNSQRFRVITGSSCVTIQDFDVERIPEYSRADCILQIAQASRYLDHSKSIILAGMWQFHSNSPAFLHAFENFLRAASKKGQHVVVMAQVPMLDSNIQRILRFNKIGFSKNVELNGAWGVANSRIREICANYNSVDFLDFSSNEIFNNIPFYGNTIIYHDNHHLNEIGSARYGLAVADYFSRL